MDCISPSLCSCACNTDQTVEMPSGKENDDFPSCESKSFHKQVKAETVGENSPRTDEEASTNGSREIISAQQPTLPIFQKVISLSHCIQALKNEHTILLNQAKEIKNNSSLPPEISKALQFYNAELRVLKQKYMEESSERKRLYNEVIEHKGNIRVFCRCRPLNEADLANSCTSVVEFDSAYENELQILSSDCLKKHFKFDHVFKPDDSQEAVFAQTKPIVTSVLDGYNVCIFAYGQTGTGKTFTMEGTPDNRGVNYRTLEELFRISESRCAVMRFEVYVSMLEVYNEKIRDLLVDNSDQPTKRLDVKQAPDGTQEVPGLVEARVYNTDEVWQKLKAGYQVRSVGSTSANEKSSRSHCVLRVTVKGENSINGQKTRSYLWLVDLAGSERVGKIEVEGERLKESQFINRSLSALGDVISALASKSSHIPYRNSKLTHMLQNSLGGDCKTLMFVQISPSSADLGETLCSLNFATRVRGVESGPARKQTDPTELLKLKQMAEKLKHEEKETKRLQDLLQSSQNKLGGREHLCKNLQDKIKDLESQLAEERKMRLKHETRAFIAPSSGVSSKQAATEKKPPLAPTRFRVPLRRITNSAPQSSPRPSKQTAWGRVSVATFQNKENIIKSSAAALNKKSLMVPRRASIAVRPPPPSVADSEGASFKSRRRVSVATLRPESSFSITTPLRPSALKANGTARGSLMVVNAWKNANQFSPMLGFKTSGAATPGCTSKFMRSPLSQAGSSRPSHPALTVLQRKKSLVWSPLRLKSLQNRKPSLIPSRPVRDIL